MVKIKCPNCKKEVYEYINPTNDEHIEAAHLNVHIVTH